nr:thiamine pyrophosphate-dependent enzyme [Escherichia coli]
MAAWCTWRWRLTRLTLRVVSPVVIGSVRARLDRLDEPSSNKVLPITIHGDAAVTGQGVVQETLNMSKARGYEVGGTVRIVINNECWFHHLLIRWMPVLRRTVLISARWFRAPIFHVNAGRSGSRCLCDPSGARFP